MDKEKALENQGSKFREDIISEGGNAEENPFMADDGMKDTHMPLKNTDHSMEPMDGQMNHTRFGSTIPAGTQKRDGRRKPVREFREVPNRLSKS